MLTLRPFRPDDRLTLASHLSDAAITAALPDFSPNNTDLWLDHILCDPFAYAVTLNEVMIGACRLDTHIAYWIASEHRGKGYAEQVNNKLCRIAISQGKSVIHATVDPLNTPSIRLLLKCGFKQTSTHEYTKYL